MNAMTSDDEHTPTSDELAPREGDEIGEQIDQVRGELAELTRDAHELTAGEGGPGTDIVPARSNDPVVAKRQMAEIRSRAERQAGLIAAKRKELERLLRSEMEKAEAVLGPMQEMVERLEAGIFTVNLYLGRDEEIVLLRDGESAPADTPIALRQSLLFMDEECAAFAEEGGISPVEIEQFDRWLLEDPRHLDQVLPETKGIVALRPRRDLGRYRESHRAAELAEANRRTYWLVRNGQRVYRTLTQLEITTDRVLPYADEFERIFTYRERGGKRVPLKPGSYDWERAQEHAEERERTFMRVGLILEGLLHRTPIFHPLPDAGVSFLSPLDVREGRVLYITDAEGLLGMGEESFEDWRRRLMGELRVGMRVILGPGLDRANEYDRGHSRLSPNNANMPHGNTLYVIEETGGRGFVFRYHEGERYVGDGAWGGGEYREPKRRASCTIKRSDSFVLPFDLADPDDMRRFLLRRGDRHHYASMFPVIKAAIAAKEREAEVEEPFMTMLAGVLARENGVSVAEAQEQIPDLVWWWKTKNRYHRPLLLEAARPEFIGDEEELQHAAESGSRSRRAAAARQVLEGDRQRRQREEEEQVERSALAVRMIVAEHARRLVDARRPINEAVVSTLRDAHPVRLLIARPRRAGYVVLTPAEGHKNVYVHEHEYSARGELRETREWVLPRAASVRTWVIVETSERWEQWDLHAAESAHLRGPDEQPIIEEALRDFDADPDSLALAWDGRTFTWWTAADDAKLDTEHLLTARQQGPSIQTQTRRWKFANGAVRLGEWREDWHAPAEFGRHERVLPWDKLAYRSPFDEDRDHPRKPEHNVLRRADPRIARFEREAQRFRDVLKHASRMNSRVSALVQSVEDEWLARAWATERRRFDEDFGDPELWEAHRKSKQRDIRLPSTWKLSRYAHESSWGPSMLLWDAVARLAQAGEDPEGYTVADVLREANQRFGTVPDDDADDDDLDDAKPIVFRAPEELHGYVLSAPPDDPDDPDDLDDDEED
jgi:hypothetical protein